MGTSQIELDPTKVEGGKSQSEEPSQETRKRAAEMDLEIRSSTENNYYSIVSQIISVSSKQLENEEDYKKNVRAKFVEFFQRLLCWQFAGLVALLAVKGFANNFSISEAIITTYIVSVFVETLGVVAVMVKYAFDSTHEVQILDTMNQAIREFQKYESK